MPIYNPKDSWHKPYFNIIDNELSINPYCALSEEDYEKMCEIEGVNPIYPNGVPIQAPVKIKPKYVKRQESIPDMIKRKRAEQGIFL